VPAYVAIVRESPVVRALTFRHFATKRLPEGGKFVADDGHSYEVVREVAPPDSFRGEPGMLLVRLVSAD
jgi:hypothetical protein